MARILGSRLDVVNTTDPTIVSFLSSQRVPVVA